MKTGNLARLELDDVADGIGADVRMESNRVDVAEAVTSAAVREAETSATKQVDRIDVAMRTPVRARSGNSRSGAATMESLLTFAEAARVLGISLRQFRRLVDGGRVAFVKVSERTPRVRPSEPQRFLDATLSKSLMAPAVRNPMPPASADASLPSFSAVKRFEVFIPPAAR